MAAGCSSSTCSRPSREGNSVEERGNRKVDSGKVRRSVNPRETEVFCTSQANTPRQTSHGRSFFSLTRKNKSDCSHAQSSSLVYLMREEGGGWK